MLSKLCKIDLNESFLKYINQLAAWNSLKLQTSHERVDAKPRQIYANCTANTGLCYYYINESSDIHTLDLSTITDIYKKSNDISNLHFVLKCSDNTLYYFFTENDILLEYWIQGLIDILDQYGKGVEFIRKQNKNYC